MARRQPQTTVTLFPFLAVLVCAMGSLILLLLVMTRKIREDQREDYQRQEVPAAAPAVVPFFDRSSELLTLEREAGELEQKTVILRQQAERLRKELAAARATAADRRVRLNALREALAANPQPNKSLENSADDLETLRAQEQGLTAELSAAEAALVDKRDQLARAEDDLREAELALFEKNSAIVALRKQAEGAQAAAEKSTGTETLLEFSNATGTSRIPVVVDVTANGYELLPSGVKITAADMEQFPVRDNPLLSAVYAAHRHRSGSRVTAEPYVLLLVRPGGSLPFYGAQRIFQEAKIHYGYELLQPEVVIFSGESDHAENQVLARALTEVFRRRETLYSRLFEIAQEERQRLESGRAAPGNKNAAAENGEGGEQEQSERRLAVRPDGRVIEEAGPPRRRLEGRFYAGGVAPPSTFFENRASSAVVGAPRGRLNAAQAEQMAEEFAEAYARQRAIAEASRAATAERMAAEPFTSESTTAEPAPASSPESEKLRSAAEQRFAETLFGGDGSLQGSRLIGPRSDAFGGLPPTQTNPSLQMNPPLVNPGNAGEVQRVPWQHLTQSANDGPNVADGAAGMLTSESSTSSRNQSPGGESGKPMRLDKETLRLMDAPARRSSSLKSPVGIVVFLDERHLAVAQQPAVEIPPDQSAVAEAALLRGINNELEDARRSPKDDLLPVVRFVVSPGGERRRLKLVQTLKQAGIPSVTQYELTPYMLPGHTTGYATLEEPLPEAAP
jgi:hypothetical protein